MEKVQEQRLLMGPTILVTFCQAEKLLLIRSGSPYLYRLQNMALYIYIYRFIEPVGAEDFYKLLNLKIRMLMKAKC